MKGKKTYTQHSVAFPNVNLRADWHVDEVGLGWYAADGGTYGEMRITFMRFNDRSTAFEVSCFNDSIALLTAPEITTLLDGLKRLNRRQRDAMTPEKMIARLEQLGFKPSSYHSSGGRA